MPVTDSEQLIREATATILSGTAVQTAVGRATGVLFQRSSSIGPEVDFPVLLYDLVSFDEATGNGRLILTALAEGTVSAPDAAAKCREILRAAVDALTYLAFAALGLEVVPFPDSRQSVENDPDVPGTINREGQPLLQQADAFLGLRLVSDL